MIIDVAKKEFVKNCLKEFLYKNSTSASRMFGFAPCDYQTFNVNAKSIGLLTDYLFAEMESQKSFFEYSCDGLLDDENKILKLPYRNSEDIRTVLDGLKNRMYEYRAHHRNEDTDLRKLIDCVEKTYQEVVHIEAVEREQKRKEEEEKKEYDEYLRLKKKYEA